LKRHGHVVAAQKTTTKLSQIIVPQQLGWHALIESLLDEQKHQVLQPMSLRRSGHIFGASEKWYTECKAAQLSSSDNVINDASMKS
jgi:hypothetical protein